MRLILPLILAAVGVGFILYLSWLPQPNLSRVWFIPKWLAAWADVNSNATIRTGVPFVFLGILIGIGLILGDYSWYSWFFSWFGLTMIVLIAEVGQLSIPYRSFDWLDISWGGIGSFLGLGIPITCTALIKQLKVYLRGAIYPK